MAFSKNAPITDYFKRLNQSLLRKRPCPDSSPSIDTRERIRTKFSLNLDGDGYTQQDDATTSSSDHWLRTPSAIQDQTPSSSSSSSSRLTLPCRTSSSPTVNGVAATERPMSQSRSDSSQICADSIPQISEPLHPSPAAAVSTTPMNQRHATPVGAHGPTHSQNRSPAKVALPSSQRVVRDGETYIRNSDDESDASLEDIDALLDHGRSIEISTPDTTLQLPSPDDERNNGTRRETRGSARARRPPAQPSSDLPKKYKYSLGALVEQKRQDDASKAHILRANSMLQSYDNARGSASAKPGSLDTSFIDSVMKEHADEDDIGRLKNAIQRTEALQHSKSWAFFDDKTEEPPAQDHDFPSIQDDRLSRLLSQPVPRQQAFIGGYAGEYAMKVGLPDEVLLWIMDEISLEPRDDLRLSYASTLNYATDQLVPLLTPQYVESLCRNLGASAASLHLTKPVIPRANVSRNTKFKYQPTLLSWLNLLARVAGDLGTETRIHLIIILCRLSLDHAIVKDGHALSTIGETFASLVESTSEDVFLKEFEEISSSVYHTILDVVLRLQLLQVIPAWSRRLIAMRRKLALAFLFQDPQYLSTPVEYRVSLEDITSRLQGPQFAINSTTDFGDLAASISILTIAIDSGDPPPSPRTKEAEKAYNKDVDALSSKVNSMFNDIVDVGASHMKRTEAKEVLEGFQRRLEFAVRTKPKPKKLIYGGMEALTLQREKMKAFTGMGRPHRLLGPASGPQLGTRGY